MFVDKMKRNKIKIKFSPKRRLDKDDFDNDLEMHNTRLIR